LSDRHATLLSVVPIVMPMADHLLCLHHLQANIDQNVRQRLGGRWGAFLSQFWSVYRAVSPEDFQKGWDAMVKQFPEAADYLNTQLWPCQERWAWTFVVFKFTAAIRTNGRVESENRVTKTFGGPKTNVMQLFDGLNERTSGQSVQEMRKARDSSRRQHPRTIETMFPGVLSLLRQLAGPYALQECYKQMEESVFYRVEVVPLPHGVRNWQMINMFTNDNTYLGAKWVLRLIHSRGLQVRNVLRVVHQGTGKQHLVALLDNKSYVCDCAMGMNLGIPCRHYFSVLTSVREFRFHISVVRS
ncbi:hypothetical protein FA13DRAFT_1597587, partial [Coprinellus micaceus]